MQLKELVACVVEDALDVLLTRDVFRRRCQFVVPQQYPCVVGTLSGCNTGKRVSAHFSGSTISAYDRKIRTYNVVLNMHNLVDGVVDCVLVILGVVEAVDRCCFCVSSPAPCVITSSSKSKANMSRVIKVHCSIPIEAWSAVPVQILVLCETANRGSFTKDWSCPRPSQTDPEDQHWLLHRVYYVHTVHRLDVYFPVAKRDLSLANIAAGADHEESFGGVLHGDERQTVYRKVR